MWRTRFIVMMVLSLFALAGCQEGDGDASGPGGTDDTTQPSEDAGAPPEDTGGTTPEPDITDPDYGDVFVAPDDEQFIADYQAMLVASEDMSFEELMEQYYEPRAFIDKPAFDALEADHLDLIDEALALTTAEREAIEARAFVVSDRLRYDSHPVAYLDVFVKDLPVLITTDSILFAIHNSYDLMLKRVEERALIPTLRKLLDGMHGEIAAQLEAAPNGVLADALADADLYLTVARSLLAGDMVEPLVADNVPVRNTLLDQIETLQPELIELFGRVYPCDRPGCAYDFSQFKPRGHYTETEELQRYFKAMIWLGRTELALTRFQRELVVSVLLQQAVEDADLMDEWLGFDQAIQVFVGKSDNLTLEGFTTFLVDQEASLDATLSESTANALMKALEEGGYAQQRIMSQIMATDPFSSTPTLLPPIFCFFGQRFVIDSYVFHNVTYDRIVYEGQKIQRTMPDPLDPMFVLGYQEALPLLEDELTTWKYAKNLHAMRYLTDSHGDDFWHESMYNVWLDAIRALSVDTADAKHPSAMRTRGYAIKAMNTGLASWAELRHDTILYVKQSYSGVACDYPDGYVEPIPGFYSRVARFATTSGELFADLQLPIDDWFKQQVATYFDNLAEVGGVLENISRKQQDGEARSPDETAFIKSLVQQDSMCGGPLFTGWYADLFFEATDQTFEFKPTIADVHTDPNSTEILHVGTGFANLMVMVVDTECTTKAYVGPVSSYYETREPDFTRLNDEEWEARLGEDKLPPRPHWTDAFLTQ